MFCYLLIIVFLIYFLLQNSVNKIEPFDNSYGLKTSNDCGGDIPLINANCNKVPNFPNKLEPKPTNLNQEEFFNQPFHDLASKKGLFTFAIPELKYDGIYSKSVKENKCCWSFDSKNKLNTYGTNNFLHAPKKNLYGKTIIEPPECAGFSYGFSPCIYRNDCHENKPCKASFKIK